MISARYVYYGPSDQKTIPSDGFLEFENFIGF